MKKIILLLIVFIPFTGCWQSNTPDSKREERKKNIENMEDTNLTTDQIERKKKSEEYCKNYGIPTIEHLPCIESEQETTIRTKDEIVHRALALSYLGLKSEGLEPKHLNEFDKKYTISPYFTDAEKIFVNSSAPTEQQLVNANWRYESLHVLLWCLGYIDSLSYPDKVCSVSDDIKIIIDKTESEFMENANLRSKIEILDEADLIYRIDWACVNARINNEAPSGNLNPSIVYERHYVLNWLINYMDQPWDEISTDT